MREYPTTQEEKGCTAGYFSGMSSRLANLLSGRRQPTDAQRIPSAPTSPTNATAGERSNDEKGQAHSSAPYVPQHAATTFSRTATPRQMRRENEILLPSTASYVPLLFGPPSDCDQLMTLIRRNSENGG
ncbi:hypothetical protein F4859DRAFT_514510 [Xylaria cf. heliscus]|nr:hypothetical protein F4859DRAFT_514510 [Xylaria cf. heliscus]